MTSFSELSYEQQYAFQKFTEGKNLFITGPGGTGKTKLIQYLVDYTKCRNKSIQVCALTGCASLLLGCNARTIHSWSGIRLGKGPSENIISQVMRNKYAKNNWKTVKVLIIDEVSMMSKKIFEVLEEIARRVRGNFLPFGGIQIIFTGDFFQLPPVSTFSDPETSEFCFESNKWHTVFPIENNIELKTIFRQNDPKYIEILSQVRKGELSNENIEILQKYVKREYNPEDHNDCQLIKLFPIKSRAEYVNKMMFDRIQEPINKFDVIKMKNCVTYIESGKALEPEIVEKCKNMSLIEIETELENLTNNIPCSTELELKKGTAVMCCVNLDLERGICNGSQGIIIDFIGESKIPSVRFSNGITTTIPVHYWQSEEYPNIAVGQYPLVLAWALTIHKIQGATVDMAQIDIGQNIFEYGQTYVALSRIKSLEGLFLSSFHPLRIKSNPKVIEFYKNMQDIPMVSIIPIVRTSILTETNKTIKEINFEDYVYKNTIVSTSFNTNTTIVNPNIKIIKL